MFALSSYFYEKVNATMMFYVIGLGGLMSCFFAAIVNEAEIFTVLLLANFILFFHYEGVLFGLFLCSST